jgi:hypothetical protein
LANTAGNFPAQGSNKPLGKTYQISLSQKPSLYWLRNRIYIVLLKDVMQQKTVYLDPTNKGHKLAYKGTGRHGGQVQTVAAGTPVRQKRSQIATSIDGSQTS